MPTESPNFVYLQHAQNTRIQAGEMLQALEETDNGTPSAQTVLRFSNNAALISIAASLVKLTNDSGDIANGIDRIETAIFGAINALGANDDEH